MSRRNDPEKRGRILAAARRVFLVSGYEKTTMSSVAGEAGIAVGTLYLYFDSKEDLAASLEDELFRRIESEVVPMLSEMSTPDGIERILDAVIRITADEAETLRMNNSGPGRDTPMRRKLRDTVAGAMRREMEGGRIRTTDPGVLSDLVITTIEQAMYQGLVYGDGGRDLETYRNVLVEIVRRAILP